MADLLQMLHRVDYHPVHVKVCHACTFGFGQPHFSVNEVVSAEEKKVIRL